MNSGKPSRRNYRAMKDDKLLKVIHELQSGGDAYRRAVNGDGDPDADLAVAIGIAVERGLMEASATPLSAQPAREDGGAPQFVGAHLAAKGSPVDLERLGDWLLEPKLDGFWLQTYTAETETWAWLRSGVRTEERIPHIAEWLDVNLPPATRMVGELVLEDGTARQGSRLVHKRLRSTKRSPQDAGCLDLSFAVFDCLEFAGEDVSGEPYHFRRQFIETRLAHRGPVRLVSARQPTLENYQALLAEGFEGGILKDESHRYRPGQRGSGVIKLKSEETVDVVVMDVGEGTGEFAGMAGFLVIGQYRDGILQRRGRVSSGLDFATRRAIWEGGIDGPRDVIGRVLELRHMGVDVEGFRHPVFLRWREDLSSSDVEWHDGR